MALSLLRWNSSGKAIPITTWSPWSSVAEDIKFTATTFQLDRHIDFPLIVAPTLHSMINGPGCSAGVACGTSTLYVPTSSPVIQYFNSTQTTGNPANYAIFANPFLPGTNTPGCTPQEMDWNQMFPGQTMENSLVFNDCH